MAKSHAKVLKKKISASSEDDVKSLNKMFSQITGSSDPERDVILPKINKIYCNILEYNKLFNVLLNFKVFTEQFTDYSFWFDDIKDFLTNLIASTDIDIKKNYEYGNDIYTNLSDSDLCTFYKNLKDNIYIKKIVITGSRLSVYKNHIAEADKLDDIFINREPGLILQPLAFSTFDLKTIWIMQSTNEKAKKFILSILRRAYLIGIDTYDILTSPDVDIKKFSRILVEAIINMKKQIPRCDKAFGIIEKSVKLLEDNFKNYFRGSVEAGNPSVIMESFIIDITQSQKASPSVTAEFRKIVAFLQEKSSQNNDPKIKKLFGMLNNQFTSIDTELGVKPESENTESVENTENTESVENTESAENVEGQKKLDDSYEILDIKNLSFH